MVEELFPSIQTTLVDSQVTTALASKTFLEKAFLLHEHAEESSKIAHFIDDIVAGHDAMKEEREKYYNEQLMPPGDKTACENIIAAILGE